MKALKWSALTVNNLCTWFRKFVVSNGLNLQLTTRHAHWIIRLPINKDAIKTLMDWILLFISPCVVFLFVCFAVPYYFRVQLVGCCWSHPTTSCLTLTGWTPWFRPTGARSTASCVLWRRCSLPPSTKRSLTPRSERLCQSKRNKAHLETWNVIICLIPIFIWGCEASQAHTDLNIMSRYVADVKLFFFFPLSPGRDAAVL